MSTQILAELVEAGVHFGHQTKRWNPKMKSFIMGTKNQIHILNIEETVKQIDVAAEFLADLARRGKKILFVGCKRQAQEAVKQASEACGQYYVNHRWLGGTLTNMETIKKSIARLNYLEEIESKPEFKL
ncbi:MAG: rpsb bact: ribosomal protein us2, partial [Prosthecobacter sp.]|nr:rpsb bact: ribosomal protein us2 [Prosthecobacter sp.]